MSSRMTAQELRTALMDPSQPDFDDLLNNLLFEGSISHCFQREPEDFNVFRDYIAKSLGIDPGDILIVGSGHIGYSISPTSYPKNFHQGSDIDVAIVSEKIFDEVWDAVLKWCYPKRHYLVETEIDNDWCLARKDDVFMGCIDVGSIEIPRGIKRKSYLTNLRDICTNWYETFMKSPNTLPNNPNIYGREISGRLYRDRKHLEYYQADCLRKLKNRLIEEGNHRGV